MVRNEQPPVYDPTVAAVNALLDTRGWTLGDLAQFQDIDLQPITQCRSVAETHKQIGITRQFLHALTREGQITAVRIGRRKVYEQSEIDRFIASHRAVVR
jgi:hypothetical protein